MLRSICRFQSVLTVASVFLLVQNDVAFAASNTLIPGRIDTEVPVQPGTVAQEGNPDAALHIVVLEGEDGVNIVKKKTAVKPVVEVRDRNNNPVGGAVVTFTSPTHGASVVFANGAHSLTVVTDATGHAALAGLQPVGSGAFNIGVSASFANQTATAVIARRLTMRPQQRLQVQVRRARARLLERERVSRRSRSSALSRESPQALGLVLD